MLREKAVFRARHEHPPPTRPSPTVLLRVKEDACDSSLRGGSRGRYREPCRLTRAFKPFVKNEPGNLKCGRPPTSSVCCDTDSVELLRSPPPASAATAAGPPGRGRRASRDGSPGLQVSSGPPPVLATTQVLLRSVLGPHGTLTGTLEGAGPMGTGGAQTHGESSRPGVEPSGPGEGHDVSLGGRGRPLGQEDELSHSKEPWLRSQSRGQSTRPLRP